MSLLNSNNNDSMLKEALEKASEFIGRLEEPDSIYLVLDREGNDTVLYSNENLPGYSQENGVYTKRFLYGDLPKEQQEELKAWVAEGAEKRHSVKGIPDCPYLRLEEDVLAVRGPEGSNKPYYAFVPTGRAVIEFLEGNDDYSELLENLRKHAPTRVLGDAPEATLVHETLHGESATTYKEDLRRELAERGYELSKNQLDELFSTLAEMRYTYEHHPELAEPMENDIGAQIPYKDRPHSAASEMYFRVKEDPNLGPFVGFIFGKRSE